MAVGETSNQPSAPHQSAPIEQSSAINHLTDGVQMAVGETSNQPSAPHQSASKNQSTSTHHPVSVLVVVCHPVAHSLCSHLADSVNSALQQAGVLTYTILDLYHSNIDVILTADEIARKWPFDTVAQQHINLVQSSKHLICIHPDWWGAPPALLVGWIQKIFIPHIAFRFDGEPFEQQHHHGLFKEKSLYIISTTDSDEHSSSIESLHAWWRHITIYSSMTMAAHHIIPNVKIRKKVALLKQATNIVDALMHSIAES